MSINITTAFVNQFKSNVLHLSQQKGSKLEGAVRLEPGINGEKYFIDRLGKTAAVVKTVRHADTPLVNSDHTRRMLTLSDYEWADLVDHQDKVRLLISPESEYAKAASNAMGRSKDDVIIACLSGNAYGGQAGATAVPLPSGQKVATSVGGAGTNFNLAKLLAAKAILDNNDVDQEDRYLVISPTMLDKLFAASDAANTRVTSSDYNTIRALVRGEVDTYLGFKWIMSTRLPNGSSGSTTTKFAYAFHKNAVCLGIGADVKTEIGPRADKSYAIQVYLAMTLGATRVEEEGVVEIDTTVAGAAA